MFFQYTFFCLLDDDDDDDDGDYDDEDDDTMTMRKRRVNGIDNYFPPETIKPELFCLPSRAARLNQNRSVFPAGRQD